MIITLTGSNDFLLRRRLQELVDEFVSKNSDLALERIDATEVQTSSIIESVQSLPFLADSKMVVVRNLGQSRPDADTIEQIISSTGPTTELIFYEPSPDKRATYFKTLQTKTKLENYSELEAGQLATWLTDEAKNMKTQLSHSAAAYMVDRLGPSQAVLYSELEKLSLASPEISRSEIDLLTEASPQSKIFDLVDAVFSGNRTRAARLYDEQREQRVEPQQILAMITWQLHILALANGSDMPADEVARQAGMKAYPIRKARQLATKIPNEKLASLIDEIAEIDLKAKTSLVDIDDALRNFVLAT